MQFTKHFFITGYVQILGAMLSFEFKLIDMTQAKLEMKFHLYSARVIVRSSHVAAGSNFKHVGATCLHTEKSPF